jgi:phospholipase/carboxylesterase
MILHGYGADGEDLIEIGRAWQDVLPHAAFFAPHAPERGPGGGRQWFALTFRDPGERWRRVELAGPALDRLIDAELAATGLEDRQLALVGFSQGAMMALHVGLRRPASCAAIVGFSGQLVLRPGAEPNAFVAEVRTRPPVLLIHGDRDDVIPADALFLSAEALAAANVPCEWHLSAGVGHGIDPEGLRQSGQFLARSLAVRQSAG